MPGDRPDTNSNTNADVERLTDADLVFFTDAELDTLAKHSIANAERYPLAGHAFSDPITVSNSICDTQPISNAYQE